MANTPQNVLPFVPETQLWPFLVGFSLDVGVANLLKIELGYLESDFTDGQELVKHPQCFEMCLDLVLDRWSQPPLRLLPVEKPRLAISRFSVSSGATELPAGRKPFLNIAAWLDFGLEEHNSLSRRRHPNMLGACIDAKRNLLLKSATAIEQLQGKGDHLNDFGLACFEQ